MSNPLSVRVPGGAEMAAIDAHLAFVEIAYPGIVDDVTGKPRTATALAELRDWCCRLARSRAARGEAPLSLPQRYALVLGLYGALVPHVSPQGIVWRAMLHAAGRFAAGHDEPVEATYMLVTVRDASMERAPQKVEGVKTQEDRPPDPHTPKAWMLKHAEAHLAATGKKLQRKDGMKACMDALGCGSRDASDAYKELPDNLKFKRGEPHG